MTPPRFRAVASLVLWCILVAPGAAAASSGSVDFVREPAVQAVPGAYATLTFALEGDGAYETEIDVPRDWLLVTRPSEIHLIGEGFVSVTVRVPAYAPAGEEFTVALSLKADGRVAASATGRVVVRRQTSVRLVGPTDITGFVGSPLGFELVVVNRGNVRETVSLRLENTHWQGSFDPSTVDLQPGEQRSVRGTLIPLSNVSSGYRHTFQVVAEPRSDPSERAMLSLTSRWLAGGGARQAGAANRPQLTVGVSTGAAFGLTVEGGEATPNLEYRISPDVSGDLSDYVSGRASTNSLVGTLSDPIANYPSSLSLSLAGQGWNTALQVAPNRYALTVGADVADWRLTGQGSYQGTENIGVRLAADSERDDLDLRLAGRTNVYRQTRTDSLAASYALDFADGWDLDVSATVTGFTGLTDADGYGLAFALNEQLRWRGDGIEIGQAYSGAPFAGIHAVGLRGAATMDGAVALRGSTSYAVSPLTSRWTTAASASARPVAGLTAGVSGAVSVNGSPTRAGVTYSVSPRVLYSWRPVEGVSTSFGVRYGRGGVISGVGVVWNRYEAGIVLATSGLSVALDGEYEERFPQDLSSVETAFEAGATALYRLVWASGMESAFSAGYRYEETYRDDVEVRHEIDAGWRQVWTSRIDSSLNYTRTIDPIGAADVERIRATVGFRDVVFAGTRINASYSVSSPTSLLDGSAPLSHEFSLGVGYDVRVSFDTPDVVVDFFGGRRGGEVGGVAFLDADLDGEPDDDERRLAGIELQIGSETATTDEQGRYTVRVPEGTYEIAILSGQPATMDLYTGRSVSVVENEEYELKLAFAPVVSVDVALWHDADNDGERDDGEAGIPFGGIVFDGPIERLVRVNGDGRATVSGIVVGAYTVRVSTEHLPASYRPTTPQIRVAFSAGDRPSRLALGAAPPPRTVVSTFRRDDLAVLPRVLSTIVAPGAEIDVLALTQGSPERVTVQHSGGVASLTWDGQAWRGTFRLGPDAAPGRAEWIVRAERGGQSAQRTLVVTVADRPPFTSNSILAAVDDEVEVRITTLYRANTVRMDMPGGVELLELTSPDGYVWTASWRASVASGRYMAIVTLDDTFEGDVPVTVVAPPDATEQKADASGRVQAPGTAGGDEND